MSTLRADTLSNVAGTKTVPTSTVVDGSAKAWVNFNGTGTVAIRAAFNVSSITDNGGGDYTLNFATPMPDANYACVVGGGDANTGFVPFIRLLTLPAPGAVRVGWASSAFGSADTPQAHVVIYR